MVPREIRDPKETRDPREIRDQWDPLVMLVMLDQLEVKEKWDQEVLQEWWVRRESKEYRGLKGLQAKQVTQALLVPLVSWGPLVHMGCLVIRVDKDLLVSKVLMDLLVTLVCRV